MGFMRSTQRCHETVTSGSISMFGSSSLVVWWAGTEALTMTPANLFEGVGTSLDSYQKSDQILALDLRPSQYQDSAKQKYDVGVVQVKI